MRATSPGEPGPGEVTLRVRAKSAVQDVLRDPHADLAVGDWLVTVLRCGSSLGEHVALPCDPLLDGLRRLPGDFFDRGGQAVIPVLAM